MYDQLDERLKRYVDLLVAHAETALWPERTAALESFRRGIARSDPDNLRDALKAMPLAPPADLDGAEALFRVVLTAYLERLDDSDINNRRQAELYQQSLDPGHLARANTWLRANRP